MKELRTCLLKGNDFVQSVYNPEKYIDYGGYIETKWITGEHLTFNNLASLNPDKVNIDFSDKTLICYSVPVTFQGIQSTGAKMMIVNSIIKKVGCDIPFIIDFHAETSSAFCLFRYTKTYVIIPADEKPYILEPDGSNAFMPLIKIPFSL
jgi:hypothetical protein